MKLLCLAISSPRSQVKDRLREAGSLRTCRVGAATTVPVSLLRTLTGMVKRECRSTSFALPMTRDGAVFNIRGSFADGDGIGDQ